MRREWLCVQMGSHKSALTYWTCKRFAEERSTSECSLCWMLYQYAKFIHNWCNMLNISLAVTVFSFFPFILHCFLSLCSRFTQGIRTDCHCWVFSDLHHMLINSFCYLTFSLCSFLQKTVWSKGRHLEFRGDGHWNDRRRTSVSQWKPPKGKLAPISCHVFLNNFKYYFFQDWLTVWCFTWYLQDSSHVRVALFNKVEMIIVHVMC